MDVELNSESSDARALGPEAATPAVAADATPGEGSPAVAAPVEGQAKAVIAPLVQPSVEADKNASAAETGRDDQVGGSQAGSSSVAIAPFAGAAADPLGEALAALEDRDYATAQRLFAAIGRKDAADAIKDALAALDRKDYATAQGLFEALGQKSAAVTQVKRSAPASAAPPQPAAPAGRPMSSDSWNKAQQEPIISPTEVIPIADAAYRRPLPQPKKVKSRRLKPLLLGTGLALIAIFGASAIYGSPLNWTFPTTKSQAIAGLESAHDVLKADLEAITGQSAREEERSAMRDIGAALTQVTVRLDQIEHEYGARLDKLSQRVDQDPSSSRFADIAARLDRLEKKPASPAAPASEIADVVARLDRLEKRTAVAAAPASEFADITTRLSKLEKRAVPAPSSAKPLASASPNQSSLMAGQEPSASNETARPDNPGPLLREYSVENVRDGVAVIDSRYGPQEVARGDFIPGAGRVLRIEKRGGDWFVVTSRGVIASGPAP
jgi:hypothetical protein